MTTEVWFRNPHNYIRELIQVQHANRVAWDRGILLKRAVDPVQHAKLYFKSTDFEILVIGEQGTAHLDSEHDMSNPKGVYPTWVYGIDDLTDLQEMVFSPVGEDQRACSTIGVPTDELPVFGQQHRVILTNLPDARTGASKSLFRAINEMLEEHDGEVMIHVHGSYSYPLMFSQGMYSADIDPRTDAAHGTIVLPNGKKVGKDQVQRSAIWLAQLNMTPGDIQDPAKRCIFNIKSAVWAGDNFERDLKFLRKGDVSLDPRAKQIQSHKGARTVLNNAKEKPGDKVACNSCSLQDDCQYFRVDSVCNLPDSETSALVAYLNSRNADRLIDAMGTILGAQATRLEKAVKEEERFGEDNPEVTRMLNSLFANTMKLAKVIDPSLTKPSVQIQVGAGQAHTVTGQTPNQIVAQAMRALEDQGLTREQITSDMVSAMIQQMTGMQPAQPAAIQGSVF